MVVHSRSPGTVWPSPVPPAPLLAQMAQLGTWTGTAGSVLLKSYCSASNLSPFSLAVHPWRSDFTSQSVQHFLGYKVTVIWGLNELLVCMSSSHFSMYASSDTHPHSWKTARGHMQQRSAHTSKKLSSKLVSWKENVNVSTAALYHLDDFFSFSSTPKPLRSTLQASRAEVCGHWRKSLCFVSG